MGKCSGGMRKPIGTLVDHCPNRVAPQSHPLIPLCEQHLIDMLDLASLPFQAQLDELKAENARTRDDITAEIIRGWSKRDNERNERERAARENRSRVYFMHNGNYIKIGFTATSPESRLATIRKAGGVLMPLGMDFTATELIGHIPGDIHLEKSLHKRFDSIRVVGEWFDATPELTRFIEKEVTS